MHWGKDIIQESPVNQCKYHHFFCNDCTEKLRGDKSHAKCPVCRFDLDQRCLLAEKILDNLPNNNAKSSNCDCTPAEVESFLPDWFLEIRSLFECPVCLQTILDPPVYQCRNGHIVCGTCAWTISKNGDECLCPVCKSAPLALGCKMANQILARLPKKTCQYDKCHFLKADPAKVKIHEKLCPHRLVACLQCDEVHPLSDMKKHLIEDHTCRSLSCCFMHKIKPHEPQGTSGGVVCCPINLPLDGKTIECFWCQKYDFLNRTRLLWICHGGDPEEKYHYRMRIFASGPNAEDRQIPICSYLGKCLTCDSPLCGSSGLSISEDFLKSIAEGTRTEESTFMVRIRLSLKDDTKPFDFSFIAGFAR